MRARQTQNRYLLFLVKWRAKTYKHNLTHFMRERHWIQLTYFTLKRPQACFDHTGLAANSYFGSTRFRPYSVRWLVTVRLGFCFVIGLRPHTSASVTGTNQRGNELSTHHYLLSTHLFFYGMPKAAPTLKGTRWGGIGGFEHLKWSVLSCWLCSEMSVLPHTHTRNIRTGNNNNNPNLSLSCTVDAVDIKNNTDRIFDSVV